MDEMMYKLCDSNCAACPTPCSRKILCVGACNTCSYPCVRPNTKKEED